MSEILGLSHLIFSSPSRILRGGSPLEKLFLRPVFENFDHSEPKKALLRLKTDERTNLTLYASAEGDLPAIELIPSKCEISRPLTSYGMIFPENRKEIFEGLQKFQLTAKIAEKLSFTKVCILEEIPSLIAISPELENHSCSMGAWIQVPNISSSVDFFANFAGSKIIEQTEDHALFTIKVMNKKFSTFLIAIFKSGNLEQNFYNDDIGLAAFGWFAKKIPQFPEKLTNSYSASPEFGINIKDKKFKAVFFYDNKSQSNEIMVMDRT